MHVYNWFTHFPVPLKLTQHCKSTIPHKDFEFIKVEFLGKSHHFFFKSPIVC